MQERIDDYLSFGVPHVWILDPASKRAYICSKRGLQEPAESHLTVPGTPIRLALREVFDQIE